MIALPHLFRAWPECLRACLTAWWLCTTCWRTFLWRGRTICVHTPSIRPCSAWRTQIPDRDPTQSGAWLWSAVAPRWAVTEIHQSQPRLCIMDIVNTPSCPCVCQLWFSNGPGVLVIDCLNLQAVRRLEPYDPPSSIVSMTTSFSLWGEEAVWMLDDQSNMLLLYHAASYQLCAKYWWVEL